MNTSGASAGRSAAERISKRIAELGDWRGETLGRMRTLIQKADPDVVEEWKWMNPVWSHDGIICTGESYKHRVKLTFANGASLKDPARLFNSSLEGNVRRAIDIHEGEEVDASAFKALVRQAVALNGSVWSNLRRRRSPDGLAAQPLRRPGVLNRDRRLCRVVQHQNHGAAHVFVARRGVHLARCPPGSSRAADVASPADDGAIDCRHAPILGRWLAPAACRRWRLCQTDEDRRRLGSLAHRSRSAAAVARAHSSWRVPKAPTARWREAGKHARPGWNRTRGRDRPDATYLRRASTANWVKYLSRDSAVNPSVVGPGQEVDHHLSCAGQFPQPRGHATVTVVVQGEVHQIERSIERGSRPLRISGGPADGASHFAADIAQLFGQRQRSPPLRRVPMLPVRHRCRSRATRAAMAARVSGLSTPRERLPNDGRRLIIESVLEPVVTARLRIQVDAPGIGLVRAVRQQRGFLVGVEVRVEQEHASAKVHDALDHVSKSAPRKRADLLESDRIRLGDQSHL